MAKISFSASSGVKDRVSRTSLPGFAAAEAFVRARAREGDLVLCLGAGDVDALGRALAARPAAADT